MRAKIISVIATVFSLMAGATSFAQEMAPHGVKTAKIGDALVLVDFKGMTLYTYDRDTAPGKSACNDRCAMTWPPLVAAPDATSTGTWTVITRDDGTKQWAYHGKPVYAFSKDAAPGDAKGDGTGPNGAHVWHVAKAS